MHMNAHACTQRCLQSKAHAVERPCLHVLMPGCLPACLRLHLSAFWRTLPWQAPVVGTVAELTDVAAQFGEAKPSHNKLSTALDVKVLPACCVVALGFGASTHAALRRDACTEPVALSLQPACGQRHRTCLARFNSSPPLLQDRLAAHGVRLPEEEVRCLPAESLCLHAGV